MAEIEIIEKPDWITWDDIHNCLWEAHSSNRANGMTMRTTTLKGKELEERLVKGSIAYKTFVALDGDKLVGTASVAIRKRKTWYVDGLVAYELLAAVLPEYSGKGIYKQLNICREREGERNNCELIYFDTAEHNKRKINIEMAHDYQLVDFFASKSAHYSVVLAKWYKKKPCSDLYIKARYLFTKYKTKIKYKERKIKRFSFL